MRRPRAYKASALRSTSPDRVVLERGSGAQPQAGGAGRQPRVVVDLYSASLAGSLPERGTGSRAAHTPRPSSGRHAQGGVRPSRFRYRHQFWYRGRQGWTRSSHRRGHISRWRRAGSRSGRKGSARCSGRAGRYRCRARRQGPGRYRQGRIEGKDRGPAIAADWRGQIDKEPGMSSMLTRDGITTSSSPALRPRTRRAQRRPVRFGSRGPPSGACGSAAPAYTCFLKKVHRMKPAGSRGAKTRRTGLAASRWTACRPQ